MTKEQAYKNLDALEKTIDGKFVEYASVSNLIEDIYCEFERRTCKNCLFYKDYTCCNVDSYLNAKRIVEEFGCNLFERRENEIIKY